MYGTTDLKDSASCSGCDFEQKDRPSEWRSLYSKCLGETAPAVSGKVITYIQHSGFSAAMSVTLRGCC